MEEKNLVCVKCLFAHGFGCVFHIIIYYFFYLCGKSKVYFSYGMYACVFVVVVVLVVQSKMTWGPYFWFNMWRAATSTISGQRGGTLS